ncbi:von Willebrand factor type A domain-containing protein [Fontibacillus phaseoli]|uniref:von Willebrand factor type A domain-containing protein n=1 Tax=Fontibacillus phaseoli TaxID=1416533 RepID=A0A369BG76_9BACL|nr:VWA domain-containing protein [Fontibacillus phaseoli]RCX20411.1 von Willebrand factor type A domain-containing protein [Fontibacillus phaseoli]
MGIASWAGLWFGLALPAIVIMYLFKRKYLDTIVPSHLLWDRVLRNIEANRPWQKLQSRLLLWLQLLAAALLVVALMLPFVWVQGGRQGHTVIIADTSASMSAVLGTEERDKDTPGTTLDRMKKQLQEDIDGMSSGQEVTLLKLGSQPQVLLSREKDRNALKKAVSEMSADYGKAAYRETLSLASALTRNDPEASVEIYTDSQWPEGSGSGNVVFDVPVQVNSIQDEKAGNTAIVQFGVRQDGEEDGVLGIAVVKNYRKDIMETSLDLYGDGQLLASNQVVIEGGKSATVSFGQLDSAEVYRLSLSGEDAYAPDNEAFAFREEAGSANILLLSSGNLFLEKALQLTGARVTRMDPGASTGKNGGSGVPALPDAKPDIIVIDGAEPDFVREGAWRDLLKETPLWTWGGGGEKAQPESGETETLSHPVTRYLSLSEAPTGQLLKREVPVWGEPLLKIGSLPAAYAGKDQGVARLVFLFALEDSDLPLRPEFPILVNNAVEWLQTGQATGIGRVMAGAKLDLPVAADDVEGTWIPQEGFALQAGAGHFSAERKQGVVSSRQMSPGIPGLWRLEVKGSEGAEQRTFLVQVTADPAESAFEGMRQLPVAEIHSDKPAEGSDQMESGSQAGQSDSLISKSRQSLVYPAALLALFVILAEWGVYQRGRSI